MPTMAALAGLPLSERAVEQTSPISMATLTNSVALTAPPPKLAVGGAFIGEGLPPVPQKLAAKIHRWEYVDMGELLPEFLARQREEDEAKDRAARQGRKVTDILTWVQRFSAFVAVMAPVEPQVVPEMMAYLSLIVRASQDFEGLGWVRYDSARFGISEASGCNRQQEVVRNQSHAICYESFSSEGWNTKVRALLRDKPHGAGLRPEWLPGPWDVRAPEAFGVGSRCNSQASPSRPPGGPHQLEQSGGEACRKWNTGGCSYPRCRFRHVCSGCGGNHQLMHCRSRKPLGRLGRRPY